MTEQWCLLWSKVQNALHIEPLDRTLSLNRVSYRDDEAVHYAPIAVGTQSQMQDAADAVRGTLAARDKRKHPQTLKAI